MEDEGKILICRAQTPGLAEVAEDNWKLPVHCMSFSNKLTLYFCFILDPPQSLIQLGGSLDSSNIREFDDVYFECK